MALSTETSPKRWELLQRWAMRAICNSCALPTLGLAQVHLSLARPPGPEVEEEHSTSFLAGFSLQHGVLSVGQDREERWVLK